MVLLLQYAELRMQDAACIERARLNGDKLLVYQQKTGTPGYCPLPPLVIEKLNAVENENADDFFYDRVSQPESMVKSWDRVFQRVFERRIRAFRVAIHTASATRLPCRCC